jgi:hypothetical protein
MAASQFERLDQGRPPTEEAVKQPQKLQHAQKSLEWFQRWNKPAVNIRDFHIYGSRPRDRESTLNTAKILVENGWLSPLQSCRFTTDRLGKLVRKPIVRPQVAK